MASGIYAIEQIDTTNCYVGSSWNIQMRWSQHLLALNRNKHHSIYLQRAWNKYGADAFRFVVLETIDHWQKRSAIVLEQKWIDIRKPVFNYAPVAGSPLGIKRSEETVRRMKASLKGRISPRKGVILSEETKQRVSETKKKKYAAGWRMPRSAVEERASKLTGQIRTPEQRANMSKARKGVPFNEEHKHRLSEAAKRRAQDPEQRKRLAEIGQRGRATRWGLQ